MPQLKLISRLLTTSRRPTFGRASGDPLYLAYFDANGDGRVDNADFFQLRARFGAPLP